MRLLFFFGRRELMQSGKRLTPSRMSMKQLIWGAAALVVILGIAAEGIAQSQPLNRTGKERVEGRTPEARVKKLDSQLCLTPAQEKKVLELIRKRDAKLSAWAKDQKLSQEARTKRIREEDKKMNAAIRGMLSPAQKKTWDKLVKEAEARRAKLNSGPPKAKP